MNKFERKMRGRVAWGLEFLEFSESHPCAGAVWGLANKKGHRWGKVCKMRTIVHKRGKNEEKTTH